MAFDSIVQRFIFYTLTIVGTGGLGTTLIVNQTISSEVNKNIEMRTAAASKTLKDLFDTQEKRAIQNIYTLSNDLTLRAAYQSRNSKLASTILARYQKKAGTAFIRLLDPRGSLLAETFIDDSASSRLPLKIPSKVFERARERSFAASLAQTTRATFNVVVGAWRTTDHLGWLVYGFRVERAIPEQILREAGAHLSIFSSQNGQGRITATTLQDQDRKAADTYLTQLRWDTRGPFNLNLKSDTYISLAHRLVGTPENGVVAFFHYPKKQQRAPLALALVVVIAGFIGAIALGLGLSYLFSNRLVETLFLVGRNLRALLKGRPSRFPQSQAKDERDTLVEVSRNLVTYFNNLNQEAASFVGKIRERNYGLNAELRHLKREIFESEVLLDVVNATHFMTKPVQIVERILDKIIAGFHFERASVMILNEKNQILELKVVKKWDPESNSIRSITPESKVTLHKNEGIAGLVMETGKAHVAESGFQDPLFKRYSDGLLNETVNSIICLPLKRRTNTFGVINISTSKPRGMVLKHDMDLLERVSEYASQAIANARLYTSSVLDPSTQTYKKRYLLERLKNEARMARRTETPLSVLAIEVDHLENYKKRHGLALAERILQEVAEILANALRKTDIIGRYSSEVFVVVLPHTGDNAAIIVAEKIRELIAQRIIATSVGNIQVHASVGTKSQDHHHLDTRQLLTMSLEALKQAKKKGGNMALKGH